VSASAFNTALAKVNCKFYSLSCRLLTADEMIVIVYPIIFMDSKKRRGEREKRREEKRREEKRREEKRREEKRREEKRREEKMREDEE
jgi:hypothetical protein